jgi:hypothetical protein
VFTCPHAFLAAGAGLRIADVHVRVPGVPYFYEDSLRADCHAFPAALAIVRVEPNVFRFTPKKKIEWVHNFS